MRKIFIILVFFILVGCTNDLPDYTNDITITLNINTEVVPTIVSSRGEGVYDTDNKTYKLTVSSAAPVDISLSHNDLKTMTISFSSNDLLKGAVEKDVQFGEVRKAKVIIEVISSAATKDIEIIGHEYTSSGNKFTIELPNRSITSSVKVLAPGYQEITVPITPDLLVVGHYLKTIVLPKLDEVVISYQLIDYKTVSVRDLNTNEWVVPTIRNNIAFYVLNKGDEIYYNDQNTEKNVYLKVTQNQEIFPLQSIKENKYIVKDNSFIYFNQIYFEYNNQRYKAIFNNVNNIVTTNIPVGSNILYQKEGKVAYKKVIEQTEMIDLTAESFNELEILKLKVKIFNNYDQKFLEKITDNNIDYYAVDDYFELPFTKLILNDYYCDELDLLLQNYINDEWVFNANVMPKADGLILRFKDAEGNPIMQEDLDYHILDEFLPASFIFDIDSSITYDNRDFHYSYTNYLPKLKLVEIGGKSYYDTDKPINIATDVYQFALYFEEDDSNKPMTLQIKVGESEQYYFAYGLYVFDVKVNDTLEFNIFKKLDEFSEHQFIYVLNLTEELLETGFSKRDSNGAELPIPSFEIQVDETVEITNIILSHEYYFIDNMKVSYLFNPQFILVEYKIDGNSMFHEFIFNPNTTIYIVE